MLIGILIWILIWPLPATWIPIGRSAIVVLRIVTIVATAGISTIACMLAVLGTRILVALFWSRIALIAR